MKVRTLQCPGCGGRTKLAHGEREAACMHCGETVRLSQAVLQEQQRARAFPPMTPLRLGMKAQFRGKEYEAVGRQVMQQVDEGEISRWEEWNLVSPDGDLLFLEYDEGKWKVSEPFVPQNPISPQQLEAYSSAGAIHLDGKAVTITDRGNYQVAHAEGEFPWMVVPGRNVRYVDAASGFAFYCVEWTDEEIEYYRGEFLDERQVYSMFGLHALLRALDRRAATLRSRKLFGGWSLALGTLALVVWGWSLVSGRVVPRGTGTAQVSTIGDDGVRFGPIPLSAVDRVHRLEIDGRMREQSVWIGAALEDENEQELISADRDMWDESGRDSDGYWHESDLHASVDFVLKQPGNYYVRLYAEPEPGRAASSDVTASFRLKEKALFPHYLGFYGFGAILFGAIFLMAGVPSTTAKVWENLKDSADD